MKATKTSNKSIASDTSKASHMNLGKNYVFRSEGIVPSNSRSNKEKLNLEIIPELAFSRADHSLPYSDVNIYIFAILYLSSMPYV